MMLRPLVTFLLILAAPSLPGKMLVATCESPTGWRVDLDKNRAAVVGPDGMSDSVPMYFVDTARPEFIYELTEPIEPAEVSKELVEALSPKELKKYSVVLATSNQITALERSKYGTWSYSLFPNLGYVVIGRQTHWSTKDHAIGATYYAKCLFHKSR